MQGKKTNIITFVDVLKAFKSNLTNWKRKVKMHNYKMFEKLDKLIDARLNGIPDGIMENGIMEHLSALESEFERYFLETTNEDLEFVRNSFRYPVDKPAGECQDNFLEHMNDSTTQQKYQKKLLPQFRIVIKKSYHKTTKTALCIFLPFVLTNLYESGFFSLLQIKSKQRNEPDVEDD